MTSEKIVKVNMLSNQFRHAFEQCRLKLSVCFQRFPNGSCGDATLLLGSYLKDKDCGKFIWVKAVRGRKGKDWTTHGWLKQGDILVDITADQFPEIEEKVIVKTQSEWHASFEIIDENQIADYRLCDPWKKAKLGRDFNILMTFIDQQN